MSTTVSTVSSVRTLSGPAALRALAEAFAHIADFRPFVEMLEASVGKAAFFDRAEITLTDGAAPAPEGFTGGQFTLPITGAEELHGVLKVASPGRVFGPEDLHLMAALAGVLAAVMDHAKRHGETRRNLEVLKFLLNLAPVGMVALDGDGRVLAANDVAYRWLGAESAAALAERLAPETLGADWRAATAFHFQADGKLIYAEARAHGAETGEGAARVYGLVLADLGAEQMRLADGLQRELYRGRWLGRPVALVVAETDNVAGGVLAGLPALREALREGETAGPLNALQLGLVIAGADEAGALGVARVAGKTAGGGAETRAGGRGGCGCGDGDRGGARGVKTGGERVAADAVAARRLPGGERHAGDGAREAFSHREKHAHRGDGGTVAHADLRRDFYGDRTAQRRERDRAGETGEALAAGYTALFYDGGAHRTAGGTGCGPGRPRGAAEAV